MNSNPSQTAPELLKAGFRVIVIVMSAFIVGVGVLVYIGVKSG